jgi:DNA repair exonuclease SbcCD ATPase subunit
MRDAATSLQKLQFQKEGSSKEGRRSFLFGANTSNTKKRLSKQAEEEMDFSMRKIRELEDEISKLSARQAELDYVILKHHAAVLAYSQTQNEKKLAAASIFSHSKNSSITSPLRSASPATARMLGAVRKPSGSGNGVDETELNSALAKLSQAVGSQTPPQSGGSRQDKMRQLNNMVDVLVRRLEVAETLVDDAESHAETLRGTIEDMVAQMDPEFDRSDLVSSRGDAHAMRACALGATAAAALKLADSNGTADSSDDRKVKMLLRNQLESLTQSYETNRSELEKLEIANVDLKAELQENKFALQAEIKELQNELTTSQERVGEYKERCENLSSELESVVRSLEDVTRQAVDYESERTKLEQTVQGLQQKLYESSQSTLDKRVSMMAVNTTSPPRSAGQELQTVEPYPQNEPLSVSILRHEFRRIIQDINDKHVADIKREQTEKRKLESLLRSIKTSSYMNSIPPERLEALGIVDGLA